MTPISLKFKSRALFSRAFFLRFSSVRFSRSLFFFSIEKYFLNNVEPGTEEKHPELEKNFEASKKNRRLVLVVRHRIRIPARKSGNQGWISELVKNWAAVRLVFYRNANGKLSLLLVRSWTNPERFLWFCSSPRTFIVSTMSALHLRCVRTDP